MHSNYIRIHDNQVKNEYLVSLFDFNVYRPKNQKDQEIDDRQKVRLKSSKQFFNSLQISPTRAYLNRNIPTNKKHPSQVHSQQSRNFLIAQV